MSARTTMNEVIRDHNVIHLATIDSEGDPNVRALLYAAGEKDNVLYLLTQINSRKANQIEQNSHVGFAIDRDAQSIQDRARSKYIKGKGTAVIITEQKEMGEAVDALMAKFPYLADNPGDSTDLVGIRLTLHHVIVSDHTIKFGHIEDIVFPQE